MGAPKFQEASDRYVYNRTCKVPVNRHAISVYNLICDMPQYDPSSYGAKADGATVDTKAIQEAIDDAYQNGGGTVVFKSGLKYISGSLVLKSNVFLEMEPGSLLKASTVSLLL